MSRAGEEGGSEQRWWARPASTGRRRVDQTGARCHTCRAHIHDKSRTFVRYGVVAAGGGRKAPLLRHSSRGAGILHHVRHAGAAGTIKTQATRQIANLPKRTLQLRELPSVSQLGEAAPL